MQQTVEEEVWNQKRNNLHQSLQGGGGHSTPLLRLGGTTFSIKKAVEKCMTLGEPIEKKGKERFIRPERIEAK